MNLTKVTAPTPPCFSYIAELKIGKMILAWDFIRLSVFPLWQRNDLASPIPVPDQDVAWKKLHQEQQELIGSLSAKSFEEISLGRAGDWVVSLRLGAAGDRMQSVFYSESRHAPFFPPSSSPYDRAKVFFLISKRLLCFSVNDYTQTALMITLTILPVFLLPHNTSNISWDIYFLLVSL